MTEFDGALVERAREVHVLVHSSARVRAVCKRCSCNATKSAISAVVLHYVLKDRIACDDALANVSKDSVDNVRNNMYVASEAIRLMEKAKQPAFSEADTKTIDNFKKQTDHATKFIPTCVKVAVAIALGLGTMVGWSGSSSQLAKRSANSI
jgi:phosphate/sulfate permease